MDFRTFFGFANPFSGTARPQTEPVAGTRLSDRDDSAPLEDTDNRANASFQQPAPPPLLQGPIPPEEQAQDPLTHQLLMSQATWYAFTQAPLWNNMVRAQYASAKGNWDIQGAMYASHLGMTRPPEPEQPKIFPANDLRRWYAWAKAGQILGTDPYIDQCFAQSYFGDPSYVKGTSQSENQRRVGDPLPYSSGI